VILHGFKAKLFNLFHFKLKCFYFNQLDSLCDQLDDIWKLQEGSVILYSWFQFLQDESLKYLGIIDSLKIEFSSSNPSKALSDCGKTEVKKCNRSVQDIHSKAEILPLILQYDQTKKQEAFNVSAFSCPICFENKIGSNCLQFTGNFY